MWMAPPSRPAEAAVHDRDRDRFSGEFVFLPEKILGRGRRAFKRGWHLMMRKAQLWQACAIALALIIGCLAVPFDQPTAHAEIRVPADPEGGTGESGDPDMPDAGKYGGNSRYSGGNYGSPSRDFKLSPDPVSTGVERQTVIEPVSSWKLWAQIVGQLLQTRFIWF